MKVIWVLQIFFLVTLLSACTIQGESYRIPLSDFKTEVYDELQIPNIDSIFTINIVEEYVDRLTIRDIVINIPKEYEVKDSTTVSINFEVEGYELCEESIELRYFEEEVNTSNKFSCSIDLSDEWILKNDFFRGSVDIYIIIIYTNEVDNLILGKHLFAEIEGNLIIYLT